MESTCRVCKNNNFAVEVVSLYNERKGEVIANMIMHCAGVTVSQDDDKPQSICCYCLERLENAFKLRQLIRQSDAILRERQLKQSQTVIKEEPMEIPHENENIHCDEGPNGSNDIRELQDVKPANSNMEAYTCCFWKCFEMFTDYADLLQHAIKHHGSERIKNAEDRKSPYHFCSACNKGFRTKRSFQFHQFYQKMKGKYSCTECQATFLFPYMLAEHEQMHAQAKEAELAADDEVQVSKDSGDTEMVVDPSEEESLQEKEESLIKETKKDKSASKAQDKKSFACEECDKTFSRKFALNTHVKRVHGERPFSCNSCDTSFALESDLKKHVDKTHGEKTPIACNICNKQFAQARYLNKHILKVHGDTGTETGSEINDPEQSIDNESEIPEDECELELKIETE